VIKKGTIRGRITNLSAFTLVGFVIVLFFLMFFSLRSRLRLLLEDNANSLVEAIGPTLELGLYSEEVSMLKSPVKGLLSQNNILYVSVYNLSGENLIEKSKIKFEQQLKDEEIEKVKKGESIPNIRKGGGRQFLDCVAPVYPLESKGVREPIGILRIGMSLEAISSAMKGLLITILSVLILALGAVELVTTRSLKSLFTPLYDLKDRLREISEGKADLKVRLSEDTLAGETDELATYFNKFVQTLQKEKESTREVAERMSAQAEELSASAEQMTASSQEISSTMQEIAGSSEKQAEESQTASEMSERALNVVHQSLNSAEETLKSSENISELSGEGRESSEKVRLAMNNVTNIIHELEEVVQEIQKYSEEISGITDTVREISERTNILALNATIESAKAGESGKGFAVVAEEIRKLANRSAKSTRTISEIINEISRVIDSIILKTEETIEEVRKSKETSLKSADFLKDIALEITHITKKIREIATINKEGEESVKNITEGLENIASIAEENAASSQEISAAIEELSASIQELSGSSQETSQIAENLYKITSE